MKITDDRDAKRRLNLLYPTGRVNPGATSLPEVAEWPRFPKQSFNSYREMNAWKLDLIKKIMRNGGVRWKS